MPASRKRRLKSARPTRLAVLVAVLVAVVTLSVAAGGCAGSGKAAQTAAEADTPRDVPVFNADSAYIYVKRQVDFGPRVPNTPAHDRAAGWLADELCRHGAEVKLQKADLKAFDGTVLKATNIIGQFNPDAPDRLLLLAHYDCRPWADEDPDEARRKLPVDGANDGASGVGVLLEIARQLGCANPGKGIDILFTDAEDYGSEGDDDSWALGTRWFAEHPFREGYRPKEAILLDMVGAPDAVFNREYFSQQMAPSLCERVWAAAENAGYGHMFPHSVGGVVTDDHMELLKAGIPAVDIIDFRRGEGFAPTWHTGSDTMEHIDRSTLRAVGQTLLEYIY